ncbi:ComEC/Rec2 family competence protein [Planctomycetota bacterium]
MPLITMIMCLGILLKRIRRIAALAVIVFFMVGAGRAWLAFHCYPGNHVRFITPEEGELVRLMGVVDDDAQANQFFLRELPRQPDQDMTAPSRRATIRMRVQSIKLNSGATKPACGLVLLRTNRLLPVHFGDRIETCGRIFSANHPRNPGAFDYGAYLNRLRIYRSLIINEQEQVKILERCTWSVRGFFFNMREYFAGRLCRYLDGDDLALYAAGFLGIRSLIMHDLRDAFVQSGSMHLLSISGLHLVIWIGLAGWLLYRLPLPHRLRMGLIMAGALFFVLMSGARTPAMRALLLIWTYCGAAILIRITNPFNTLALAAILVLLIWPRELWSPGFYLSFLAVLGIIIFAPRLEQLLIRDNPAKAELARLTGSSRPWFGLKVFLLRSFAVSLSASIMIFPVTWSQFNVVALAAPLANILGVLGLTCMITSGIFLLAADAILPFLAPLVSYIAQQFSSFLIIQARWFSSLKGGHLYLPDIHLSVVIMYYIWLAFCLKFLGQKRKKWRALALPTIVLLLAASWQLWRSPPKSLTLTALYVGNGSCIVLECPQGEVFLFDCGSARYEMVGANQIAPFLWQRGIGRLDGIILSHEDADHVNGVPSVLQRVGVRNVYISNHFSKSEKGNRFLKNLQTSQVPVIKCQRGQILFQDKHIKIEVLHPPGDKNFADPNDASILLRVSFGSRRVLLTGDLEDQGFTSLAGEELKADVLQVPHHGSFFKNYLNLLNSSNPEIAILSSRRDFPDKNVLDEFQQRYIKLLQTSRRGAVTIAIHPNGTIDMD